MSKGIKLKNNNYLDSSGIVHNRTLLSEILNKLIPVSLYDNSSGTTGTVTLSETSANFTYLEIFYSKSGCYSSVKIYNPNGKTVTLHLLNSYGTTAIQYLNANVSISGTTITKGNSNAMNCSETGAGGVFNENNITITKVIGYR